MEYQKIDTHIQSHSSCDSQHGEKLHEKPNLLCLKCLGIFNLSSRLQVAQTQASIPSAFFHHFALKINFKIVFSTARRVQFGGQQINQWATWSTLWVSHQPISVLQIAYYKKECWIWGIVQHWSKIARSPNLTVFCSPVPGLALLPVLGFWGYTAWQRYGQWILPGLVSIQQLVHRKRSSRLPFSALSSAATLAFWTFSVTPEIKKIIIICARSEVYFADFPKPQLESRTFAFCPSGWSGVRVETIPELK